MNYRCLLLIGLVSFSSFANAAPRIEPRLLQILNSPAESGRVMKVMVDFPQSRPSHRESVLNRAGIQMGLMKEAILRQEKTMSLLRTLSQTEAQNVRWKRYWISNSIMIQAPVSTLRKVAQQNDDFVLRTTEKFSLISPMKHSMGLQEPRAYTYGLEKMRIPEVRQKYPTLDGRGVRVGILDTGIDRDHQDLHGKTIAFADFSQREQAPYDDHGHGTHVAGTIAGGAASGTQIGVAPAAKLIVGKIFDEEGSADEDQILDGMQWIADPDGNPQTQDAPHLVSNSWGNHVAGGDPENRAACRAIHNWLKLSILPVFAAGNHGPRAQSVSVPAACPGALGIGATDEFDEIARFSSRGPVVWSTGTLIQPVLTAPGVKTLSAGLNGRYVTMSGTSMATPHVAGVAALVIQANPQASTEEVGRLLIRGAVDLGIPGLDPVYGHGRIDAMKSLFPKN